MSTRRKVARTLGAIWQSYIDVAKRYGLPFIATTPTRRMNRRTLPQAGLAEQALYDNVAFLREMRDASGIDMLAGGMMGCIGNAFSAEGCVSAVEAYDVHRWAAERYQKAGVDFLLAALIPTLEEALGISRAMAETGLPYLVSFTIQGDASSSAARPLPRRLIRSMPRCPSRRLSTWPTACILRSFTRR